LYLDYMNLDAALGAAAEAAVKREKPTAGTATSPRPPARLWANYWRWFGATAAFAALLVFAMLAWHRNSSWSRPDLAAAISSTKTAIARLSKEPPSSFPAWLSPTASLLDQPRIPQ
jgi:anti-sigma-K factor RskA